MHYTLLAVALLAGSPLPSLRDRIGLALARVLPIQPADQPILLGRVVIQHVLHRRRVPRRESLRQRRPSEPVLQQHVEPSAPPEGVEGVGVVEEECDAVRTAGRRRPVQGGVPAVVQDVRVRAPAEEEADGGCVLVRASLVERRGARSIGRVDNADRLPGGFVQGYLAVLTPSGGPDVEYGADGVDLSVSRAVDQLRGGLAVVGEAGRIAQEGLEVRLAALKWRFRRKLFRIAGLLRGGLLLLFLLLRIRALLRLCDRVRHLLSFGLFSVRTKRLPPSAPKDAADAQENSAGRTAPLPVLLVCTTLTYSI